MGRRRWYGPRKAMGAETSLVHPRGDKLPTTFQGQEFPGKEVRGALRGLCITPLTLGENSQSPHPG